MALFWRFPADSRDASIANVLATQHTCPHIHAGSWPFEVALSLDHHLGIADAVVSCSECGACYLIEMLDWQESDRLYRLRPIESAHAERLIRDLSRGSCDLSRAGAEIHHLATSLPEQPDLILASFQPRPEIMATIGTDSATRLPVASWRELPCDGSWIDYTRSNVEIVNE